MSLFVIFLKNVSILAFVATVLLVYACLPEAIALNYPYEFFPKDYLFYTAIGFFVVSNLLLTFFVRTMKVMPLQRFNMPHYDFWMKNAESRSAFFFVLQDWAYTFMAVINFFSCLMLQRIWHINLQRENLNLLPLWIAGAILFLGWLIYIFVRIRIKKLSIWQ